MAPPRVPLAERFWAKVDKTDTCWLWLASKDQDGYGKISAPGREAGTIRAHRWSYETLVGPIPDGLQLDHLCRNRACVNPEHLEPVTCRENLLRGNTFQAANAAKTHCPHGHPYDEANTYVLPDGGRACIECRRRRGRLGDEPLPFGEAQRRKTHCPAGHAYTPEGTYRAKRGARVCKVCACESARRRYHARKAAA